LEGGRSVETSRKGAVSRASLKQQRTREDALQQGTRRSIAYIAARLITGKPSGSVYDYEVGQHTSMSATIEAGQVNAYDYGRSAHVTGNGASGEFNLYDFGQSAHVSLKVEGTSFSGYDFGESCHFNGTVEASGSTSLYDYSEGRYFNYSI
jgi:hypothetical protein